MAGQTNLQRARERLWIELTKKLSDAIRDARKEVLGSTGNGTRQKALRSPGNDRSRLPRGQA